MNKSLNIISIAAAAFAATLPVSSQAESVIAHRGVFHDISDGYADPENSINSVTKALLLGLGGVELDLRMTSDGQIIVMHDFITNRTTTNDFMFGKMNPVDVALGGSAPTLIHVNDHTLKELSGNTLKTYGRNAKLLTSSEKLLSLTSFLDALQRLGFLNRNFKIILDIQDPSVLAKTAEIVQNWPQKWDNVYLKFFARSAIDSRGYNYVSPLTCANYAKDHHMTGLNIIPQINDGELFYNEDVDAGINVFNTKMSVNAYLSCWKGAESYAAAARMNIVSASVPADNPKATTAADEAMRWAASNHIQTMTIVPNPDAGRRSSATGPCRLFSFRGDVAAAANFDTVRRAAKQTFSDRWNPNYVVYDVMGDIKGHTYYTGLAIFSQNLCN